MPYPFVTSLLHHATAQGSRSTVLRPLNWLAAICVAGILGTMELRGPGWVLVVFATMLFLVMALYMGAYIFCLGKNPDMLRSETYSIQKLALEKGVLGDSLAGTIEMDALSASSSKLLSVRAEKDAAGAKK